MALLRENLLISRSKRTRDFFDPFDFFKHTNTYRIGARETATRKTVRHDWSIVLGLSFDIEISTFVIYPTAFYYTVHELAESQSPVKANVPSL